MELSLHDKRNNYIFDNLQHIIFALLMMVALGLSIYRLNFGFGGFDETFYLTIPQRIINGDSLLSDEWHLSQLSGIMLTPFVWIYEAITKSTEGILIYMRYVYVLCHLLTSIFAYILLRKYKYGAVVGLFLYFLFIPYNIMALSYNTMAIDMLLLTGCILSEKRDKCVYCIISGVAFSMAALCCPYLAVVYILFGAITLINAILKKRAKENKSLVKEDLFPKKSFLWFSVGVVACAIPFIIFILSRASITEIMQNIPYMLQDPEHSSYSIGNKIRVYIFLIFYNKGNYILCASVISYIVFAIIMIIDKKKEKHSAIYIILSVLVSLIFQISYIISGQLEISCFNSIVFPFIFVGFTMYVLNYKKLIDLFVYVFVLGILYSLCVNMSSNQERYVIHMAMSVSNVASFVFAYETTKKLIKEKAINIKFLQVSVIALLISLCSIQAYSQIYVKLNHFFFEKDFYNVPEEKIQCGIAKGITATKKNVDEYTVHYQDIQYYENKKTDNILFLSNTTWFYLDKTNFQNSAYSAWLSGVNKNTIERLDIYYKLHSDKVPKYIYIDKNVLNYENQDIDFTNIYADAEKYGYDIEENEVSYKLERKMVKNIYI